MCLPSYCCSQLVGQFLYSILGTKRYDEHKTWTCQSSTITSVLKTLHLRSGEHFTLFGTERFKEVECKMVDYLKPSTHPR